MAQLSEKRADHKSKGKNEERYFTVGKEKTYYLSDIVKGNMQNFK